MINGFNLPALKHISFTNKPLVKFTVELELEYNKIYLYHGLDFSINELKKCTRLKLIGTRIVCVIASVNLPVHFIDFVNLRNKKYNAINKVTYYNYYIELQLK